jgi:hypothetical protein
MVSANDSKFQISANVDLKILENLDQYQYVHNKIVLDNIVADFVPVFRIAFLCCQIISFS